jgi:hypothetical protein
MKCHKALAELGRRNAYKGVIADPLTNLARIYALTGEKDLALEKLDMISKLPFGPSYGQLRLDAEWDSLRGDPRFEKNRRLPRTKRQFASAK